MCIPKKNIWAFLSTIIFDFLWLKNIAFNLVSLFENYFTAWNAPLDGFS